MLNSINTNVGAQVALQNLNNTSRDLATTQSRINTGLKVASAKDNAAIWAIAENQRGEVASYNAVKDSLQRGQSAVDVALSAGESINGLLKNMKQLALSASDANLDQASRDALQEEYNSSAKQIKKFVSNASFNGVNLIDGSSTGYKALANSKGTSTVDVAAENLTFQSTAGTAAKLAGTGAIPGIAAASTFTIALDGGAATTVSIAAGDTAAAIARKTNEAVGKNVASVDNSGFLVFQSTTYGTTSDVVIGGGTGDTTAANVQAELGLAGLDATNGTGAGDATKGIQVTESATFNGTTDYTTLLKQLDDSIANVAKSIGRMGSGSKAMDSTLSFVSKLQDTLDAGIGNLVDADLAKESARLQSLQTKQQLGVQALSIANQSSGILLGLFR